MHDPTTPPPDPGSCSDHAAELLLIEAEIAALRAQLAEEVRTRELTIVDAEGIPRLRLWGDAEGGHVAVLDAAGRERLRLAVTDGAGTVAVVGPDGSDRLRLVADDAAGHIAVLDGAGRERVRIGAEGDAAHVTVHPATAGAEPTYVDLFALDADPEDADDRPYVGLELVDRGDSVAGLSVYETHPPRLWSIPLD